MRFITLFLSLILLSCVPETNQARQHQVSFQVFYKDRAVSCQSLKAQGILLSDFRMYIDQLRYFASRAAISQPQMIPIQYLDFNSLNCDDQKLFRTLEVVESSNIQAYDLGFQVGVPYRLNHQNPVKAEPPLNLSSMHWQWLSGYKFLRLEFEKAGQLNRFHLGSWGCEGKLPDAVSCKQPNRINILLEKFRLNENIVEVHLDSLFAVESKTLCMGDPNDPACQVWTNALKDDVFKIGESSP